MVDLGSIANMQNFIKKGVKNNKTRTIRKFSDNNAMKLKHMSSFKKKLFSKNTLNFDTGLKVSA